MKNLWLVRILAAGSFGAMLKNAGLLWDNPHTWALLVLFFLYGWSHD